MIDRKDWNSGYIDKSFWIFSHLEDLNLSAYEALVLLVINFLNESHQSITYENLMEKCHLDADAIEDTFESLSLKGYLTIDTKNKDLRFLLEGLLDSPISAGEPINQSLLSDFQLEFGRPFSPAEMERIIQLSGQYEESMIRRALDEAAVYDKRSLNYIESILQSWKRKGLSPADIEAGKR